MTMQTLAQLNMRQLHAVLALLKGGSIGFDAFRNPETAKKTECCEFLLKNWPGEEISDAVKKISWSFPTAKSLNYKESLDMARKLSDTTKPTEKPTTEKPTVDGLDPSQIGAQIGALLGQLKTQSAALDTVGVQKLISEQISQCTLEQKDWVKGYTEGFVEDFTAKIKALSMPVRVEVKTPALSDWKDLGITHHKFPDLLKACYARTRDGHRLNVWIKGPAGSGKTTAAHRAADALGLPFHLNGAISTEFSLTGFVDAGGSYHRTPFREAFEHGGVYLFDEIDSSDPRAVLAFNSALANGVFCFPDGKIARHSDCVILAGANTSGVGATSEYVGRMKQDAAFLDRFVLLEWPLDEALEKALATNQEWLNKVKKTRANLASRAVKNHMITPRASVYGSALLEAGLDMDTVTDMCLRKGLSEEIWEQVRA